MVRRFVVVVGVVCVLTSGTLGAAASASSDDAIQKFSRGLCNIVTCPFEIIEQSKRVKASDGSCAGMTYGLLRGIAMTGVRALVGVYEVITFPIPVPKGYQPILREPISFFPEPAKK